MSKSIYEIDGPHWIDRCFHGREFYIGTVESIYFSHGTTVKEIIDVYVYPSSQNKESWTCLRFGNADAEYYSPGSLAQLLKHSSDEPWYSAVDLILNKGVINYVPQ